ncbi:hypothetical protein BU15DRAFT_62786 [Melanogaster broomeanus]|nr:hypothetical protein BU15DRAFT_62786 [Melanogaster broomeanus]
MHALLLHPPPVVATASHRELAMVVAIANPHLLTVALVVRNGPSPRSQTITINTVVVGSLSHRPGSSPTQVTRESYWEEHILRHCVERHSSGLEQCVDELEGENQVLHEDLDDADDRLTQEWAQAVRSDQTIESLEWHVSTLQDELTAHQHELAAAWQPPRDHGFPSIPQSQDGNGSGTSNAGAGPSNSREWSALPQEPIQTTLRGQEVKLQGKVPEARPSASGSMTMETSSCPKPTKDEPVSEDYDDDASPPTVMQSVDDSVVLTINKRDVAFSGEAAKRARSAYQKGHIAPISQGVRHFRDSASPLMISDVDRLFANARNSRAKVISQAQWYGHMLAMAFFMQQSALLLMMPGQYRAITERFNISIAAVHAIGPMQNFGPNSNMIDLVRVMAYRGVTWTEADDACLYGCTLAQHLLTGNTPLPDNICRVLQEYELRVLSADLTTWYIEELPAGMAPALSRVGPALVEAFGTSSGMVVSPGEASSTHEGPIPGPQDQDHDMEGPPAPPVMGTIGPDTGNTSTMSGPLIAEPMIIEPGELIQSVEPGLAQEGEGVKGS